KTDGLLLLRDLGSTNGTRVNGQRVRRAALLPNDQLTIAPFKFRIHLRPGLAPPPAAPARVPAAEPTPALDARALAHLLRQPKAAAEQDSAEMPNLQPLQRNPLPDVYPDDPEPDK